MCEPLDQNLNPSIASSGDFPVSLSAKPANSEHKRMNDGSGLSSLESFASFDRATSSWRTSQISLLSTEEVPLARWSESWPTAGTTRNGIAYQRPPLVPRISETEFGYLPTPDASCGLFETTGAMDVTSCFRREQGETRPSGAKIGSSLRWCPELIRESLRTGGELNPVWTEVLMGYPIGWTALRGVGMRSSLRLRNGSRAASSKRKA